MTLVRETLADGAVPVIQAYMLGKGQEVTRLLTDAGIPVLQHRDIFAVSQVYEACGMSLGRYERFTGEARARLGGRRAAGKRRSQFGEAAVRSRSGKWTVPFPRRSASP